MAAVLGYAMRLSLPMKRQFGFGYVEMAIAAVVIVGLIAGAMWFYSTGKSAGEASVRAEWSRAKLQAIEDGRKRDEAVTAELLEAKKTRDAAQAAANFNRTKWQEAKREVERSGKELASCATARAEPGQSSPEPAPVAGVRLHWNFVWLYDGAFTGTDGQPLFAAPTELPSNTGGADAAAPSPYGLAELLTVHGENAMKQSDCRRALIQVRTEIERAAAAWDKR